MKKKIWAIIALGCAIWILGVAGASDCDKMSLGQIITHLAIATPLMFISLFKGGAHK